LSFLDQRKRVLNILGFFWTRVFLGTEFVDGYSRSLAVLMNDIANAYDRLPDYLARLKIPLFETEEHRLFLFDEAELLRDAHHYGDEGLFYEGVTTYGSKITRFDSFTYPIEEGFDPPFLATGIIDPIDILQKDVDYTIEDNLITFKKNPLDLPTVQKNLQTSEDGDFFNFLLFGFKVQRDIEAMKEFFGIFAGVVGDTSELYRRAVNTAWDLRVEGATSENTIKLLSVVSDTDFVDKEGTVTDVFEEGDRLCVLTENAVYTAPLGSVALVDAGDSLAVADVIFDTFILKSGRDLIDFEDFEGLALGRGFFDVEFGESLLFVNSDVDIIKERHPDFTDVSANPSGPGYLIFDKDGQLKGFLATAEEATAHLDTVPDDIFTFFVGGLEQGVDDFMLQLNSGDPSFVDALKEKFGRVPEFINPFREIKDLYLKHNAFFIKLKDFDIVPRNILTQLFSVLRVTIHAGSTFFVIIEKKTLDAEFNLDEIGAEPDVFYVPELEDEFDNIAASLLQTPTA